MNVVKTIPKRKKGSCPFFLLLGGEIVVALAGMVERTGGVVPTQELGHFVLIQLGSLLAGVAVVLLVIDVVHAVLAAALLRHRAPSTIEHSGIRGTDAVRFAEVTINGRKVPAAIVHGLGSAAKLLDQIRSGEVQADLVEVMSCRTGCVGGAGQPYALMAKKLQRAQGLYEIDRSAMFKRSERNPVIDAMYANGLADRAHELLHIEYKD